MGFQGQEKVPGIEGEARANEENNEQAKDFKCYLFSEAESEKYGGLIAYTWKDGILGVDIPSGCHIGGCLVPWQAVSFKKKE